MSEERPAQDPHLGIGAANGGVELSALRADNARLRAELRDLKEDSAYERLELDNARLQARVRELEEALGELVDHIDPPYQRWERQAIAALNADGS